MNTNICTCGNNVGESGNKAPHNDNLETSFVHLPSHVPFAHLGENASIGKNSTVLSEGGILDSHKYINKMWKITEAQLCDEGSTASIGDLEETENVCLCSSCIERISSAINENILQMKSETAAYNDAVQNEKDKQKRLLRALNIKHGIHDIESGSTMTTSAMIGEEKRNSEEIISTTIQSLELEIQKLETIRDNHIEELQNLNGLIRDQIFLAKNLSEQEDELLTEFYSLENDAKDFEDVHRHLTFQYHSIEKEQYQLGLVQLHSALFNITVDETDRRRYPLINNLRLTHTHRPNGVSLIEINAAWSQAAQLVILVGSTTNFKSRNLRVVPLSTCAKIIKLTQSDQKIVHHLGVDFESNAREAHGAENIITSLRVFHELLNQIVLHILGSPYYASFDKIPFQIKAESIGPFDLRRIDQTDYSSWSGIVHCMACIMKWMATNVCKY